MCLLKNAHCMHNVILNMLNRQAVKRVCYENCSYSKIEIVFFIIMSFHFMQILMMLSHLRWMSFRKLAINIVSHRYYSFVTKTEKS